jgi:WD40 repeat protein
LYHVETGGLIKELGSTQTLGNCLGISSDGTQIVVSGGRGSKATEYCKEEMLLFDVSTCKQTILKDGPWLGIVSSFEGVGMAEFTVDNKYLWTPTGWFDTTNGREVEEPWMAKVTAEFGPHRDSNSYIAKLKMGVRYISPDGRFFFLPGRRYPEAIEMTSGRLFTTSNKLKGHSSAIKNWGFSPDMKYLATLSADGELIKWDLTHKDVDWPK